MKLTDLVAAIRALLNRDRGWWETFLVDCDESGFVVMDTSRPASGAARIEWTSVSAVCFVDGGLASDVFYVFTSDAGDPVLVPVEASGGLEFWEVLKQRGLFPHDVSGQAVQSACRDSQIWWPQEKGRGDPV